MILLLISQELAFTHGFAAAATFVTRDSIAALTMATCMTAGAITHGFAAAATFVTRDSIAALTVATCMTGAATTVMMSMRMTCTRCSYG